MSKFKIVATTWHVMHYWDLCNALKDDVDFYLIHNSHRSWEDERFLACRPIPENVTFIPYYEPKKYDLAILNCDQQMVNTELGKYKMMHELKERITDIPVIVINHGSPVYPEYLQANEMTREQAEDECRRIIKEFVGDATMVVNSYKAKEEWGWGHPIWHGMNPDEWYDLPKEPRVFTALSPGGLDVYYNRDVVNQVADRLNKQYGHKLSWAKDNINFSTPEKYKEYLGKSLLYLDVSFRTPMNRARTEAMLSGCCVIQVEGAHDLDKFAKDKENIVLVPNSPKEISETINYYLEHYDEALVIGQNAKENAQRIFNYERYRKDWLDLINSILS